MKKLCQNIAGIGVRFVETQCIYVHIYSVTARVIYDLLLVKS